MCNKKRLGQTAARLLVGMAVGLAGGAFAADSIVPVNWNVTPITDGAYLQTFENVLTWGGQAVDRPLTNSRVTVLTPSRTNTWFSEPTSRAMKIPDDASYTNTLKYGDNTSVSFINTPVFVDMRIQFTAYEGAPSIGTAKLAVFVSATNKIHVVHIGGTTTNTWPGGDLLSAWHQLTVRLESGGKCAVLLDDVTVTNNLTPVESVTTLNSLEFANSGYVDDLYVSHGNPSYPGVIGALPAGAAGQTWATGGSVSNWLASRINSGALNIGATFDTFDQSKIEVAYLVNELAGTAGAAAPVTNVTFGVSAIDLLSPTQVKITCKLTVDDANKTGVINGRIQLMGKSTIGGAYADIGDAISPKYQDFSNGLATFTFTVNDGSKFFKAKIVE